MEHIIEAFFGVTALGVIVISLKMRANITQCITLIQKIIAFLHKYKKRLRNVFDTAEAKQDLRSLLRDLDHTLEMFSDFLSRFAFIPTKFIKNLRNLIKESDYSNST